MRYTALIFAFLSTVFCYSQDMKYADSLSNCLKGNPPDSVQSDIYIKLSNEFFMQDNVKALEYGKLALDKAEKANNPRKKWGALNKIAEANRLIGNLDEAIRVHQQALTIAQSNRLTVKAGHSLNNIALVYKRSQNYTKAKEYFMKAMAAYKEADYTDGYYTIYNNLGNLFHFLKKNDSALYNYRMARLSIGQEWDSAYYAQNYNNLSMVFWYLDHKDSSLIYSEKAYDLYKKYGTNTDLANAGIGLAEIYTDDGNYKKARKLLAEMILVAKRANDKNETADGFWHYAVNEFAAGEYKNAYLYKDSAQKLYDQILNEEKLRSLNEASEKYGAEKKQLMIDQLNIENSAKESLLEEGRKTRLWMTAGLLLVLLFSVYLFYTIKQRDKTNRIINEQKREVEQQKLLIETHQKETLDSINYAKRIQYSLLAHEELLKKNLKEYFVLFRPKDIVSGDFYWATHSDNRFYLAVCDSTGHGVPGAFMSLLNINFMNEAINEKGINKPNEVFNHVRKGLIQNVSQDGQKDGMDGILICIENGKISYAAANNSPVIVSGDQLTEFPKDKMPVGAGERDASFNLHELNAKSGDMIYLYTDGFADQFGGEKGKKFKYKQLNDLLLSVSKMSAGDQKQKLESAFDNWKGTLEQVDDVCIIGIRM